MTQPQHRPTHAAVIYRRGEAWDPKRPFREQEDIGSHAAFLREQLAAGILRLSGPFQDNLGALAIFNVTSDIRTLEATIESDPTIRRGTMTYEIHPVHITLDAAAPT